MIADRGLQMFFVNNTYNKVTILNLTNSIHFLLFCLDSPCVPLKSTQKQLNRHQNTDNFFQAMETTLFESPRPVSLMILKDAEFQNETKSSYALESFSGSV